MAVRLQKFLAECGIASRRKCEALIVGGRVRVNGEVATLGRSVEPEVDRISVDGKSIDREQKSYILLNKPGGVVTSASDTHKRRTVLDCLTSESYAGPTAMSDGYAGITRVFPVGRLDLDTLGVLLLTNDGELANRLMHPRYGIEKVYLAIVDGVFTASAARKLERGVDLDDGRTAPAKVEVISAGPVTSRIRLTLREGRKREVKRMCAKVGFPVIELVRESMAGLTAKGLKVGQWRFLTPGEIAVLRIKTGLAESSVGNVKAGAGRPDFDPNAVR